MGKLCMDYATVLNLWAWQPPRSEYFPLEEKEGDLKMLQLEMPRFVVLAKGLPKVKPLRDPYAGFFHVLQKLSQVWSSGAPPGDDSGQGRETLGSQTNNFLLPWAFPLVSTQPAAFLYQVDDLRLPETGQVSQQWSC